MLHTSLYEPPQDKEPSILEQLNFRTHVILPLS